MCHLILLMPLFGLVVFWILPLWIALPVYLIILFISLVLYYSIMKAMKIPVMTGSKGMIGKVGRIAENHNGHIVIRIQNELWNVENSINLSKDELVRVTGIKGLHLYIEKNTGG